MKVEKNCCSPVVAAALTAFAGGLHAQPNLTIYGVADIGYFSGKQGGASAHRINGSGGNLSSRFGFRGAEEISADLSAGFTLESSLQWDNGLGSITRNSSDNQTAGAANAALMFDRKSTVNLISKRAGEFRIGRDYVPTFFNWAAYDPFGFVGVGSIQNIAASNVSLISRTQVTTRASNSIGYLSPRFLGGLGVHMMVASGENASNAAAGRTSGNYRSGRVFYRADNFEVALGSSTVDLSTGDVTLTNGGAAYDFGIVRVSGMFFRDHRDAVVAAGANRSHGWLVGTNWRVGTGAIPVSYSRIEDNSNAPAGKGSAHKLAFGYVHNLSPRTALYTTYAVINNRNGAAATAGGPAPVAGAKWTGYDIGVRHSF